MADSLSLPRSLLDVIGAMSPRSSRTALRRLLESGRVTVNGRAVKVARQPIAVSDRVEILDRPAVARSVRNRLPFTIVHQDDDVLVVDKPAGLLTSTVPHEKRPTALAAVIRWAADARPKARVGLIHRLDRDASGLLIFSLNERAFKSLKAQFFDHSAGRIYAAIVDRPMTPAEGTIASRLVEYADGTVHATTTQRGEPAVTHYATTTKLKNRYLLRITLETGRKHQIRSHLKSRNCPIIGDTLYGGSPAARLMLAAVELRIGHPRTGEAMTFTADVPKPLADLMRVTK